MPHHARNVKDPDEVISFGIFDVDPDGIDKIRGDESEERGRQNAMAAFVENVPLEASTKWSRRSSRRAAGGRA